MCLPKFLDLQINIVTFTNIIDVSLLSLWMAVDTRSRNSTFVCGCESICGLHFIFMNAVRNVFGFMVLKKKDLEGESEKILENQLIVPTPPIPYKSLAQIKICNIAFC